MGEKYKARDARLDRYVAVKVLPDHLAANPDALARFEREAKAVAALSHPNITGIFDLGRSGPTSYAVMELLEGETQRDRLKAGRLMLFSTQGAAPVPVKGLEPLDLLVRWTAEGKGLCAFNRDGLPARIHRVDLATASARWCGR